MDLSDELRRLVVLLQKTLRRASLTQRRVSVRLGQHPNYLSQVFAGKARLKEDVVFRVLRLSGVAVEDFYAELAAGGRRPVAVRVETGPGTVSRAGGQTGAAPGPVSPAEARRFIREALASRQGAARQGGSSGPQAKPPAQSERRRERLEATRHSARVKTLLRAKIRRAGLRQRDISRRLGEHPDYLSQVLRGNVVLKAEHVLAVLGQLEIAPAAFYGELYAGVPQVTAVADPGRELVRGVSWGEILALIDAELEASARRRSAELAPKAGDPPASQRLPGDPTARRARLRAARPGVV